MGSTPFRMWSRPCSDQVRRHAGDGDAIRQCVGRHPSPIGSQCPGLLSTSGVGERARGSLARSRRSVDAGFMTHALKLPVCCRSAALRSRRANHKSGRISRNGGHIQATSFRGPTVTVLCDRLKARQCHDHGGLRAAATDAASGGAVACSPLLRARSVRERGRPRIWYRCPHGRRPGLVRGVGVISPPSALRQRRPSPAAERPRDVPFDRPLAPSAPSSWPTP
jgi:hypothetical protein